MSLAVRERAIPLGERPAAYRALFRGALDEGFVEALRAATNGGWALGDARFTRRRQGDRSPRGASAEAVARASRREASGGN